MGVPQKKWSQLEWAKKDNLLFYAGTVVCFCLFYYTRKDLLNFNDSFRFYNSDFAIFNMMAEDLKSGKSFPFFYYGANYLGPLNAFLMNIVESILLLFGVSQYVPGTNEVPYVIGPLTSTLTSFLTVFGGIFFYGLSFRKFFTVLESLGAMVLLSLGSALLMRTSLRPLGPDIVFFLSSIILFRGIALIEKNNSKNQFLFGLLFGFSWWMNQTVVFALAPILFYFISRTGEYRFMRNHFQLRDRFFLKWKALGLKEINLFLKAFLFLIHILLLVNLILGIVVSALGGIDTLIFGIKLKIFNGLGPMKTSVMAFLLLQAFLWICLSKNAPRVFINKLNRLKYFLLGLLLAYSPVVLGRIFKLYDKSYAPQFQFVSANDLLLYWPKLFSYYFPKLIIFDIGLGQKNEAIIAWAFFALLIFSICLVMKKNFKEVGNYLSLRPNQYSLTSLLWGGVYFNLIYIFLSERARDQGAYRYAILILPIMAIYISSLYNRLKKKYSSPVSFLISISLILLLGGVNFLQGSTQLQKMKISEHLGEKISILKESKCELFLSNYWNTYVFDYFLQGQKKFAVIRGQDRTPKKTKKLLSLKLRTCEVSDDFMIIERPPWPI